MPLIRIGDHTFGERTPLLNSRHSENDGKTYQKESRKLLALLVVAYTGYYFCRTNLPIAIPVLKDEAISMEKIGIVLTVGYTTFLIGKFLSGPLVDKLGGRKTLLCGLIGSVVTSVCFTTKTHYINFAAWRATNQLFSSLGWGAVVKIVRKWHPPSKAAHAVATASLAESAGDTIVRLVLGAALVLGLSWQQMFIVSAIAGGIILIPTFCITEEPSKKGLQKPEEDPALQDALEGRSVYTGEEGLIWPILKSVRFWLLAVELFGVILIRESFASFVSAQISTLLKMKPGYSGMASSVFPLFGAISSILGGYVLDRVRPNRRGFVPFICLAGLTAALVGMWAVCPRDSESKLGGGEETVETKVLALNLIMIALTALMLYAPKIIIDGAFVMDLAGGSSRVGTVTAAVTGLGYIGGCISPFVSGVLADEKGWPAAFLLLSGIAGVTCACSMVYWMFDCRILRRAGQSGGA